MTFAFVDKNMYPKRYLKNYPSMSLHRRQHLIEEVHLKVLIIREI